MNYTEYLQIQETGSGWSYGSRWGDQLEESIPAFASLIKEKGDKILDAGCGEGRGVAILRDLGFTDVTGVDVSTEKVIAGQAAGLNLVRGDMHDLDFDDNSFDHCFCSHALEHTLDVGNALSELMRVSPRLFFIVPTGQTVEEMQRIKSSHTSPINDPSEFTDILDSLGFEHETHIRNRMSPELWGIVTR